MKSRTRSPQGPNALVRIMGSSDALQRTGDRVATAHQFANVTYNVMRGGIPMAGSMIDTADFAAFVASRNRRWRPAPGVARRVAGRRSTVRR